MAVDWTGYKLAPDFSGLAQGIAQYGANKRQSAQFDAEMDYKNRTLAADTAYKQASLLGGVNKYAPKGQTLPVYATDSSNNVFLIGSEYDPNTQSYRESYRSITNPDAQPDFNSLRIVSAEGLPTVYGGKAAGAGAIKTEEKKVELAFDPEIKRKEEELKLAEQLKTTYAIAQEKLKSDVQKESQMALESGRISIAQTEPFLDVAKNALDARDENGELIGIYGGDIWGTIAKGVPKLGFTPNQAKADNTARVRMALTNIKVGAKPAGSGNPTPSEWDMFALTMPDPETASPKQLRSMITSLEDIRKRQMKVYEKESINRPATPQTNKGEKSPEQLDYEAKRREAGY